MGQVPGENRSRGDFSSVLYSMDYGFLHCFYTGDEDAAIQFVCSTRSLIHQIVFSQIHFDIVSRDIAEYPTI